MKKDAPELIRQPTPKAATSLVDLAIRQGWYNV
jgi:hypothetical protein